MRILAIAIDGRFEDLHATSQRQCQVQGAILLDVVIRQPAILEFLACETRHCSSGGMPSLPWIIHVAEGVGRLNVGHDDFPSVLTGICIASCRRNKRCKVQSFWMS